jgi:hypothetical protein
MAEFTVDTDCEHFYSHRLKLGILDGDRRQFSGSDKGEIPWIETEYDPLATVVRQLNAFEFTGNECCSVKIRSWSAYSGLHMQVHLLMMYSFSTNSSIPLLTHGNSISCLQRVEKLAAPS